MKMKSVKMKNNPRNVFGYIGIVTLAVFLGQGTAVKATPVDLGAAGDFAILETGSGNVSLAAAGPNGSVNGNVGVAGSGNLSDGGNLPINGSVFLASGATSSGLSGNVSGTINQNVNLSAAVSAAASASVLASGLLSAGGGLGFSTINEGNNVTLNLTPGVYNLANFILQNGDVVNLQAGGAYVFNVSGALALHSAQVLAAAGLANANILFNVEGSQAVGLSGGLNNESVLTGIILAENAQVGIAPGEVNGEIISGENISIASGGSVNAGSPVPDPASTGLLLAISLVLLAVSAATYRRSKPVLQTGTPGHLQSV